MSDCIDGDGISQTQHDDIENPQPGNWCIECNSDYLECGHLMTDRNNKCPYLKANTVTITDNDCPDEECCDYVGSLYQKIVNYAIQACMRPSETEVKNGMTPISNAVLEDVNSTMDSIRVAMSTSLQSECERLGGYWVTTQYKNKSSGDSQSEQGSTETPNGSNLKLHARFYKETGANKKWGYCADWDEAAKYYGLTTGNQ